MSTSLPDGRRRQHGSDPRTARPLRLPTTIDDRVTASRSRHKLIALGAALALVIAAAVISQAGDDPAAGDGERDAAADEPPTLAAARSDVEEISLLAVSDRLIDTRPDARTVDGLFQSQGPLGVGAALEVPVAGRGSVSASPGLAVLTATAITAEAASDVSIVPCGSPDPVTIMSVPAASIITRNLLVPIGASGAVCVTSSSPVDLVIDFDGAVDPSVVRPLPVPVRLSDSRPSGSTDDGRQQRSGVRPIDSTLRVPIAARYVGLADAGALVVSVMASEPLDDGVLEVFAPEAPESPSPLFEYASGVSSRGVDIVPVGASGELCVSTTGRTDLLVEILGIVPSSDAHPVLSSTGDDECPGQRLFPDHRIVALYGTQRSARLGVLGEQAPAEAVARLDEIAAPWRDGDRPVLPAFELIATVATGTPEEDGLYNIRSSPEFVQEYLDVARRHGYYLILDLQTGQSDFLTEARQYEDFLRQPDVGLALDPEWRTPPPARPKGGAVGQVDAAEVNSVIDYVSQLVAEEGLPEKLVVVHQFQDRMITNKALLVERPGVALTIHMDGFGSRAVKLSSYSVVRVDPPLNMGLKLFFDEDIDRFDAATVLGGAFDPVPDLITYQ